MCINGLAPIFFDSARRRLECFILRALSFKPISNFFLFRGTRILFIKFLEYMYYLRIWYLYPFDAGRASCYPRVCLL